MDNVNNKIKKLEKRFKKIQRDYLEACKILYLCKQELPRMYNTELIKRKTDKINRLEKQIPALDQAGRKILSEIEQLKKYGL